MENQSNVQDQIRIELATTYYPILMNFCLKLTKNKELAEDICQSTYVRALESLHTLREPAKLKSWLMQLAKNLFLDHVKSPRNRNLSTETCQLTLDKIEQSERVSVGLEVKAILQSMAASEKTLLVLVHSCGYSYSETAKELECSEAAIRSKLHRARGAFRSRYLG